MRPLPVLALFVGLFAVSYAAAYYFTLRRLLRSMGLAPRLGLIIRCAVLPRARAHQLLEEERAHLSKRIPSP